MSPRVKNFTLNALGRDFVVGDIHGCFGYLETILETIGFNAKADRLFSVGDLVDRGPESPRALEFLKQPWFHPILGNHEMLLLQTDFRDPRAVSFWQANGGQWWFEQPPAIQARLRAAIEELPYVIQVETTAGLVGIVHADVPKDLTWQAFVDAVEAGDEKTLETAVWSRLRAQGRWPHGVHGAHRVFIGHTPCWDQILQIENVLCIDTGGVFGLYYKHLYASLTVMELTGIEIFCKRIEPSEREDSQPWTS
jgi:serine/threonine protein phosphatase 1